MNIGRKVLTIVILFSSNALIALLAGYLSRWYYVFDLIANFRVQLIVLSTLGFVCYFILKASYRLVWVSILIGGIWLWSSLPTGFLEYRPIDKLPQLTLASINVLSSNYDTDRVERYLKDCDPDLFFIIENTPFWDEEIQRIFGENYPYHLSKAQWDNFGIGLWSKIELSDAEILDFTSSYFPVISTTIVVDDKPIRVTGLHYENPVGSVASGIRNLQIDSTIAYLSRYESNILVGDMNLTPYSFKFRELIEEGELQDIRKGGWWSFSWPRWIPILGIPIDHCLVSRDLMIRVRKLGKDIGSDHLPLYVELIW